MRHTVHIFLGDEMDSVGESISNHLSLYGSTDTSNYAHVICWKEDNGIHSVREIGSVKTKQTFSTNEEGKNYFEQLHIKTVNIAATPTTAQLYICIYVQLYQNEHKDVLCQIIDWINDSGKQYLTDIYGLSYELAPLFCSSEVKRNNLISQNELLKSTNKDFLRDIVGIEKDDDTKINKVLLLTNTNTKGIGLNLDKTTMIRVLGEYALLTTEQFSDLFPLSDFSRPDVTAFGISALWFNKSFFTEYLLTHSYLHILKREGIGQHKMDNPLDLLVNAKNYINANNSLLTSFYINEIIPKATKDAEHSKLKQDICNEFKKELDTFKETFLSVINDNHLTLPEKRAMLALFLRDDDELFDDNVLLEELPTIDDCYSESLQLYIDADNAMKHDSGETQLSGPRNNIGNIYLPLEELKRRKANVRKSESFIRNGEKRLEQIKESVRIAEDCKRRLTKQGFTFGETTYQLVHDIVEIPLEKTYEPTGTKLTSVDLRKGFSPIRDQKHLGSCTAFSTSSVYEYILNKVDADSFHYLSPRFLYYNVCKKNIDGTPIDAGSNFHTVFNSLGNDGICEEKFCKYEENFNNPPSDEAKNDALTRLVTEAKNVEVCHEALTSALADGFPIVISLKVFDSFSKGHKGFVFRPKESELNSSDYGYHAMVLCGYSEKEKIYIARNSWSTSFGDNGYCYIPFSYIEDKSLCRQACIITGVSTNDIDSATTGQEENLFDLGSKDIEYSIVRVLIDEEKVNLEKLKKEYNDLNGEYIKLITELCNQGKRDIIRNHAMSKIQSSSSTKKEEKEQEYEIKTKEIDRFGSEKYFIPLILLLAAVGVYFATQLIPITATIAVIAIIVLIWMCSAKRTVRIKVPMTKIAETRKEERDVNMAAHLKFLTAGMAISTFKDLRDELERKHRYLTNFILNFEGWKKEEEFRLNDLDEDVKHPFITIISKDNFGYVFNVIKDSFVNDVWMYKEFTEYKTDENTISEYKFKIKNKLRTRIINSYHEFSMYKYLTGTTKFQYLLPVEKEITRWLNSIEAESTPFVQVNDGSTKSDRSLLFIKTENGKEESIWQKTVEGHYASLPTNCFGGSPFKLSYVQIQGMKLGQIVT